jgi:CheY-like chemotaxis protein/HPt (histidine-containing phosphotransfer) domain-containing protein
VLEQMLGDWGMQVTLAEDGVRALELLEAPGAASSPFDLALVDMHMPRLDGLELARAITASGRHPALKLVLLSSVSSPDDVQAAHEAGFLRFVAKPVRQTELRQALLGVTSSRREAPLPAAHLGRRVLVVEDNTVNQEVIGQMLRQLGCRATVASGASEGLRALCEQTFDLVLMDIQMPGMDGVEVLRTFRRGPDARRGFITLPSTPVVAVTANALDGDERRFLDLGFDDYLSKPFRQSQLLAMLNHHLRPSDPLPRQDAPEAGSAPAAARAMPAVLDAQALARLRELDPKGESRLLERVLKAFETSVARLSPLLEESRRSGDRAGVRHVAHTLKSSSASIGALALSQRCAEVETLIRLESTEDLSAPLDALSAELSVVLKAITTVLDNQA